MQTVKRPRSPGKRSGASPHKTIMPRVFYPRLKFIGYRSQRSRGDSASLYPQRI